jgi:hypothetical protein
VHINNSRTQRHVRLAFTAATVLVSLLGCGTTRDGGSRAVTPGPQARYVRNVVTARGITAEGEPLDPTSTFQVGMPVYVICTVQGVAPGTSHRLTIRWYLDGQQPRVDGAYRYVTVTHAGPVFFSVTYPTSGAGLAKLYWDEPVADNSNRTDESSLAEAITFTVQ